MMFAKWRALIACSGQPVQKQDDSTLFESCARRDDDFQYREKFHRAIEKDIKLEIPQMSRCVILVISLAP